MTPFSFSLLNCYRKKISYSVNEAVLPTNISTMDAVQGKCYCYAKFHSLAIWMQKQLLQSSSLYAVHFVSSFPVPFRMSALARIATAVLGQDLNLGLLLKV